MNLRSLQIRANWLRQTVLDMAVAAQSGHVTTAFSLAELFTALYAGGILKFDPNNPTWPDRDRFILSEGQAGIGLYPILAHCGFFPVADLKKFTGKGSTLGVHAEHHTPGVEVLTGSLGWGPSIGVGMAHAGKLAGAEWKVVVLVGDGEMTEGSCDEAFRNAANLKLDNLVIIVNRNHASTIGYTDRNDLQRDFRLENLAMKFEAYGFEVGAFDGHDFHSIFSAFSERTRAGRPVALIAETIKGNGSSLANKRGWHYRVPEGDDLQTVRAELVMEGRMLETQQTPEVVSG